MREERIIGNNIQVLLKNNDIREATVAANLGYSKEDFIRICEGRMYLSLDEIEHIAEAFSVGADELLNMKTVEEYERAGCIHYNHHFKDQANLDVIMDLFDLICDIEEAL